MESTKECVFEGIGRDAVVAAVPLCGTERSALRRRWRTKVRCYKVKSARPNSRRPLRMQIQRQSQRRPAKAGRYKFKIKRNVNDANPAKAGCPPQIQDRELARLRGSFGHCFRAVSDLRSRNFALHASGTSTNEGFSSATDSQPISRSTRSRSSRRISSARTTPAWPAAPSP